ncbi:MAG: response regulator [Deltaproteobacteria bacterium]|nr:response regulator [Deltaproteobacteria bacterium]
MADPTQLHQVIINLVTNASHSMGESGGVLDIGLAHIDGSSPQADTYHNLRPGPWAELTVRDTGCGIDPLIQDRIFEPFFTTKEEGDGTGMGLAVVHGIVHSFGGEILVESELNAGTVFRVLLPRVIQNVVVKPVVRRGITGGTEHLMLIDDEEMMLDMGKRLFESIGYKVTAKLSSTDALATFCKDPHLFDLIITDFTMPGMNGYEVSREILQIRPEAPIILCTGFHEAVSANRTDELGIKKLIMKPFKMDDIARAVRAVLDEHKQVNDPLLSPSSSPRSSLSATA